MPGGEGQGGQNDSGLEAAYYSVAVVLLGAVVWYYYKNQIASFIFSFEFYQLSAMLFVTETIGMLLFFLPQTYIDNLLSVMGADEIARVIALIEGADSTNIDVLQLLDIMTITGRYFMLWMSPVWLGLVGYLYVNANSSRFKQSYSMESLRKAEKTNWPFISTVVGTKLTKLGLDEGDFAMSVQPMAFAKKQKLLIEYTEKGQVKAKVDRAKSYEAFCLQMGLPWTGLLQDYPEYVIALFAVFAAKGLHDSKTADNLLRQIGASALGKSKKLDYSGAREILAKHIGSMKVARAVAPHAYLYTAMASMLELARTDGVIASAEFLWLKTIDRPLWYVLNNVGRCVAFTEVAGPIAHYNVEKKLRRPLKTPMVDEAIDALEEAVSEIIYKPDEDDANG